MQEDVKQRMRLARHAAVDLYLPGGNGRMYWPYRLQPQHEATPSIRRKSFKYILDSGFKENAEITNDAIIEAAHKYEPEFVIPKDQVRYIDGVSDRDAIEKTAERVNDFLDSIDEASFPSKVLIPLQPPYDLHLAYLEKHYPRQLKRSHFALGGLARDKPESQLEHIKRFRRFAGYDSYAHGFGLGVSRLLIEAIRDDPGLLDSVDASTAQQHAKNGEVAGVSRVKVYVGTAQGDEVSTTAGQYIMAEMCDLARMLAPSLTDDEDIAINEDEFPEAYGVDPDEPVDTIDHGDESDKPKQLGVTDFATS